LLLKYVRRMLPSVIALALVAALTLVLLLLAPIINLDRVTILFLIPILVSATLWGTVPAIVASAAGVLSVVFFFYPPRFSFVIADSDQVIDLIMLVTVGLLTSYLAGALKQQAAIAARRESETKNLYALSRRLTVAHSAPDIQAAIQDHLSSIIRRKVALFATDRDPQKVGPPSEDPSIPERVRQVAAEILSTERAVGGQTVEDPDNGSTWYVRAISPQTSGFGVIAVDLDRGSGAEAQALRRQIEATLAEAEPLLTHLDIGRAIREAEMRGEADRLREALIGSVSHDLRTPLTSILCAATVLRTVPALAGDARLRGLVDAILDEAERHNNDIQNLLDASRISSRGVKPQPQWCDPTDIVNAALERFRHRYADRRVALQLESDLPLLHVDSVLVEQALLQVVDNAAKYSPPESTIVIATRSRADAVCLLVQDDGAGLTPSEKAHMWDRFFRGARHVAGTNGSGLGLWVARAFVAANGGKVEAVSDGEGRGTTVTLAFPVAQRPSSRLAQLEAVADE
jgi:two-component system sensor histidine kinase KdpD